MYVRNVIPFYRAAYNQVVKREGESRDFASFTQDFALYHAETLRTLVSVFGKSSLRVLHFDSTRESIGPSLVRTMGLSSDGFDYSLLHRTINRSLTAREREALRIVNSAFGGDFSQEISDQLLRRWPDVPSMTDESLETPPELAERHASDVAWMNREFFGGEPIVSMGNEASGKTDAEARTANSSGYETFRPELEIIRWATQKLRLMREDATPLVAQRIRELVALPRPEDARIPDDFDPFAYLVINADVLAAGRNPYEHYLAYGRREGRPVRWNR